MSLSNGKALVVKISSTCRNEVVILVSIAVGVTCTECDEVSTKPLQAA